MSTRSLGQLTLDLVTRTGGWMRGMDAAERRTQQWRRQVEQDLVSVGRALRGASAVAAAAGTAVAGAFGAMAVQTINGARQIEQFAQLADTTTQEFQRMAFGARRFGLEEDQLAGILKDTNDRIGDFIQTGGGPMADFFENIAPLVGVTADDFARLSGPEALQLYVSSLEDANLSQKDMTFYLEAIASDATALLPLLANGGEEMRRLGEEAERTGNVFSALDFERLRDAKEGLDELRGAAAGMRNEMVVGALPAINDLVDALNDPGVRQAGQELASTIAHGMSWAAENSGHLVNAVLFVVDAIDGVIRVAKLAGAGLALTVIEGRRDFARLAESIYSGPIDALNNMIALMSRIPGLEIGPVEQFNFVQDLQREIEQMQRAAEAARQDMQDILLEPMASDRIRASLALSQGVSQGLGGVISNEAIAAANAVAAAHRNASSAANKIVEVKKDETEKTQAAALAVEGLGDAATNSSRKMAQAAGAAGGGNGLEPLRQPIGANRAPIGGATPIDRGPTVIPFMGPVGGRPTWSTDFLSSATQSLNQVATQAAGNRGGGDRVPISLTVTGSNGEQASGEGEIERVLVDLLTGVAAAASGNR